MKLKLFSILLMACCFINVMHGADTENPDIKSQLILNDAIEKMFPGAAEKFIPEFKTKEERLEYLQKRGAMLSDLYKQKQAEDAKKGKQKKQEAAAIRKQKQEAAAIRKQKQEAARKQKQEAADRMKQQKQTFGEEFQTSSTKTLQTGSAKTKAHIKMLKQYIADIEAKCPKTKMIMPELEDESGLSDHEILANLQQRSQILTKYKQEVEKMILFPIQGAISAKFSETEVKQFASITETIIMMNALEKTITSENQKTNPNGLWIDNLKQKLDFFTAHYLGILMVHPRFSIILQQTNATLMHQDPKALQPMHHSKSPRLSFIPERSHPYSRT